MREDVHHDAGQADVPELIPVGRLEGVRQPAPEGAQGRGRHGGKRALEPVEPELERGAAPREAEVHVVAVSRCELIRDTDPILGRPVEGRDGAVHGENGGGAHTGQLGHGRPARQRSVGQLRLQIVSLRTGMPLTASFRRRRAGSLPEEATVPAALAACGLWGLHRLDGSHAGNEEVAPRPCPPQRREILRDCDAWMHTGLGRASCEQSSEWAE